MSKKFSKSKRKTGPSQPKAGKPKSAPVRSAIKIAGGHVLLFGYHAVQAALKNPDRRLGRLFVTAGADQGAYAGVECVEVGKADLDYLTNHAVHQGIALETKPLEDWAVSDFITQSHEGERSLLVMLDQVTDPHNIGAILRSACAFGANGLILQTRHSPEADGIVAKTACGALEHVPLAFETNLVRALEQLKEAGYFAIALDERGPYTPQSLPDYPKAVLVLGAEGPGLRPLVKKACDVMMRLPMDGAMPSINVSNAAAVSLYALSTKKEK